MKLDERARSAAGTLKAGDVGLHVPVFAQRAESGGKDGGGAGVGRFREAIVHPFALAAGGDDACAAEVGEMARDFGLALAEDFDEEADADFAAGDEVEQAEASGVCEGGEEGGEAYSPIHAPIIYGLTDMSNKE